MGGFMSSVVINGDTSGAITLAAPAVAGTNTLTLPASTGTVLTTASSGQVIPSAALPVGSVLQVVSGSFTTPFTTSSTTLQASGITLSITPKFATSKILALASLSTFVQQNGAGQVYLYMRASLARGSTQLTEGRINMNIATAPAGTDLGEQIFVQYLDSPATTSSTSYNIYISALQTSFLAGINNNAPSVLTLMEIAA